MFNFFKNQIRVSCFEFKNESLPIDSIVDQLNASEAWLRSLNSTIKNYTNKCSKLYLSKFIISECKDPSNYLDNTQKYLKKDGTIRHYSYKDIDGVCLDELDNASKVKIN